MNVGRIASPPPAVLPCCLLVCLFMGFLTPGSVVGSGMITWTGHFCLLCRFVPVRSQPAAPTGRQSRMQIDPCRLGLHQLAKLCVLVASAPVERRQEIRQPVLLHCSRGHVAAEPPRLSACLWSDLVTWTDVRGVWFVSLSASLLWGLERFALLSLQQ